MNEVQKALNPNNCHKVWETFPGIVHYVGEDESGNKRPLCKTGDPNPKYAKSLETATCRSCIKRSKR